LAADFASLCQTGSTDSLLVLFALFAVAQYAGPRAIWICGATCLALLYLGLSLFGGFPGALVSPAVLLLVIIMALVIVVFAQMGARRRYVGALVAAAEELAAERDRRAQVAVARERERISREMHDVVAHSVAVMVTLSDGAAAAIGKDPARAREAMEKVSETGRQAVSDMRRLLTILRSEPELGPQPGAADLVPLVNSFKDSGLPVSFRLAATMPGDQALSLTIYRLVQEALTNVLRHAPGAKWVKVAITEPAPGQREVLVENGPPQAGAESPAWDGSGQGLVGMRQRVEVFGSELQAGPTAEGGWLVRAVLGGDNS
jgi:signal transduction histidine kinase